jgi:hypothetical protein
LIIGNIAEQTVREMTLGQPLLTIQNIHGNIDDVLASDLICKDCDQIFDRSDALIYTSANMKVGENSMQIFRK